MAKRYVAKHAKVEKRSGAVIAAEIIGGALLAGAVGVGCFIAIDTVIPQQRAKQRAELAANSETTAQTTELTTTTTTTTETTTTEQYPSAAVRNSTTQTVPAEDTELIYAKNFVLLQTGAGGNTMLAERDANAVIYPASMTKIMTLITFLEIVPRDKLVETVTMDGRILAEQNAAGAYVSGLGADESCSVMDLLYAMMLPSAADAAVALAEYASGSEEAFVANMNDMAENMGLLHTHFTNCIGLHDDMHVSTVQEISQILMYALRDPLCEKIMSTAKYKTTATEEHPAGIELVSTTLSRMTGHELEDLTPPLKLLGGKTGYTDAAGQCLASWAEDDEGNRYICVVAGSTYYEPLDAMGDTLTIYQLTSEDADKIERIQPHSVDLPDYDH